MPAVWHALLRRRKPSAADRRHDDLRPFAAAPLQFGAIAELQVILAQADAHFAEPLAVAGHGNGGGAEPGIGLDEGLLHFGRGDFARRRRLQVSLRDLPGGTRLADLLEITAGSETRAGAVLAPFVEDQPRARHQIEHRGDQRTVELGRPLLAIFREAFLVLRPEPVDDEGIGPLPALLVRLAVRITLLRGLTVGWRPRQREHVEVELAGLILPGILRHRLCRSRSDGE